ncbi:MAG TPA: glycerol-3-phosphate 1-O-acyltransferase PlsY [Pyrinomonadaceae bacterium]|nr:glycerol-3-phosphate 1-O-acyltransferase PlsY [Pyrinomonadaceae bacterium]
MSSLLAVVVAYLLGSIPFGYLIVRLGGRGDVRETGSGGTGATNVTRRAGKGAGLLTLALDALKGALAVVVARWLLGETMSWGVAAASLAVIVGHMFPVWLGFRGGKGVATGLGVFVVLSPLAVASAAVVFVIAVGLTRYVSLGSILGSLAIPFAAWFWGGHMGATPATLTPLVTLAAAAAALIILMHRANVARLLRGTENKFK